MNGSNKTTSLPQYGFQSGQFGLVTSSALAIIALIVLTSAIRFIRYRKEFKGLHGPLKAPPFNFFLGTIGGLVDAFKASPIDAHPMTIITLVHRKLNLGPLYFMDNWPAATYRQMLIVDPGLAAQVTQSQVLPKHHAIRDIFQHICGPTSMIYTEGAMWRRARSLFNPGFALGHLMTLVPGIVEDVVIFRDILSRHAESGEILQIEPAARLLAIDVVSRVVLDHPLNSQTTNNVLAAAFLAAVKIVPKIENPFSPSHINPILYYKRWHYERAVNKYLEKVLDDRLRDRNSKEKLPVSKKGRKPVIDLALDEYISQQQEEVSPSRVIGSDQEFRSFAIDQMKTFLLAGHDTTSSALAYTYYLLGEHPAAVEKLRKEFDDVFGSDTRLTAELIVGEPHLVNRLDFTTASIKEALRLFPPLSAVRQGDNTSIIFNGISYSTRKDMVWIETHSLHRRPDLFPEPDSFIPERFLPAPNNSQEIPKDAWRPFEKDPRACLGQELAMLEMKIALALTLRDFDVESGYEDWDRKLGRVKPGDTLGGKRGMFGYRAYQVLEATAKPVDGMPVKVKRRDM